MDMFVIFGFVTVSNASVYLSRYTFIFATLPIFLDIRFLKGKSFYRTMSVF